MSLSLGVLFALAASSLSGVSVSALNERSVVVATRDLDLADPSHARRLDRRIRSAVGAVCAPFTTRGATAQAEYSQCRKVAITGARHQADRALAAAQAAWPVALATK